MISYKYPTSPLFKNIIGQKLNKLTVIKFAYTKSGKAFWNCLCECGNEKIMNLNGIKKSKSCGCYQREWCIKNKTIHGLRTHKLYGVWNSMKNRCYNVTQDSYKYYGAKGITVCDEWRNNFMAFYIWATEHGWKQGMNVCRNGDVGNYSPDNCHIATSRKNQQSRKSNVVNMWKARVARRLFNDHNWSQKNIASLFGINRDTIHLVVRNKTWVFDAQEVEQERQRILSKTSLIQ